MIDEAKFLRLRTEAGLSQRGLAKLTGVSGNCIMRIEHGAGTSRLTLAELDRMAGALGVHPTELLSEDLSQSPLIHPPTLTQIDSCVLDYSAAVLLRRIHRGSEIRRNLTKVEREITLPNLVRRGLVEMTPQGPVLSEPVAMSLRDKHHLTPSAGT